jgi:hypothetical protein
MIKGRLSTFVKNVKGNSKAVIRKAGSDYYSKKLKKETDDYVAKRKDSEKMPGYWFTTGRANLAKKKMTKTLEKSKKFQSKFK